MSASSRALTWDDVSTGLERSPSLWGRGVTATTGFSLFGIEFTNMPNTAQDRSFLTSMVMLTSLLSFGRVTLMELAIRIEGHVPKGGTFSSGPSTVDCGVLPFDKWVCLQAGLYPWPVTQMGRLSWGLCTHSALQGR